MDLLQQLFDSTLLITTIFASLIIAWLITALRLFIVTVQQRNAELIADDRALQVSEANRQLHQTLGALHAQVWYLDTEARIVDFNHFTEQSLGITPLQARGRPISAILPNWNEVEKAHERNLRVLAAGKAEIGTIESYQIVDETHWVQVDRIPSFDEKQRIDGLMLFIYDITTLKSTEHALRFQKTLLEAQSESSLDGIWVVSPEHRWLSFNQRFVDMWQIPAEIIATGESQHAFTHICTQLNKPEHFQAQIQAIVADRTLEVNEVLHLQDGRHVDWFSTPVTSDDGQCYGRAWYFRDVTETRKTEKALRESERHNRALINSIPDMLFRVRKDGVFLDYHGAAGYSPMMAPETFLGRNAKEVFTPAVADNFMLKLQRTLHENTMQIYDYEMPMLNGEVKHWEQRLVASGDDEILLIVRDITARKQAETTLREAHNELEQRVQERTAELRTINSQLQLEVEERSRAEEALRVSEERLELALRGADLGLIDIDLQTGKAIYNERWAEIRGYQLNHFYDTLQSWLDSIHPDDQAMVTYAFDNHLDGQVAFFEQEYRIRTGDDSWRWVRCRGRVVSRDYAGQPLRFSGTQMDITEYKQLKQQLLQSQKMEAVGRLAGGVAHDFNNILTVITSYSELALRQLQTKQGQTKAPPNLTDRSTTDRLQMRLNEIRRAAEKAARLTRQLLLFSRSESVSPVVLDMNRLVVDIEDMLERLIGEHIHLDIGLDPAVSPIKADPGQIEQILLNLVVNGRDAMPDGGTVRVSTRRVALADQQTAPHPDMSIGLYTELAVHDNGCGMDAATQEHIFEPFFTTKGPGKGTGLGLATVFGAVQQNHGYIAVTSAPGAGTTFRIYFPCNNEEEPAPVANTMLPTEQATGIETILLVEDEDHIRSLACTALEDAGFTVIPAATGEEALALTTKYSGPIHLLLTDVVMPGISGVKLSNQITALRPSTKVLYMSGYTDGELNMYDQLDDNHCFLHKPFTPSLLTLKVRDVLDRPQTVISPAFHRR